MGNTRKTKDACRESWPEGRASTVAALVSVGAALVPGNAAAEYWRNNLYVQGSEIYSSNINLSNAATGSQKNQDSFTTLLRPGISIQRQGKWNLNLNYSMQNLFYQGKDSYSTISNFLQFNSHGEVVKKSLFVTAYGTVGQYNNSSLLNPRYQLDNISRPGNSSEYKTFSVNPYWTPHFGGYVDGVVGVRYSNVSGISGGGVNGSGSSGSNLVGEYLNLYNGKEFNILGWRANFINQDNFLENSSSSNNNYAYRNLNGEIRYRWSEQFEPFIQAGNFQNNFGGNTSSVNSARNGGYWNAGLIWSPSRKTFLQAGYGPNNYFISALWQPSKRTYFNVTFRDSDVGGGYGGYGGGGYGGYGGGYQGYSNNSYGGSSSGQTGGTGFSGAGISSGSRNNCGTNANGSLGMGSMGGLSSLSGVGGGSGLGGYGSGGLGGFGSLSGVSNVGGVGNGSVGQLGGFNAGTTWNAFFCHATRLTNFLASYNEYITTSQIVLANQQVFDQGGGTGSTNSQLFIPINQPTLTNEAITQKRGQVGVGIHFSKTTLNVSGYQANIDYQYSGSQDLLGLSAAWSWRFMKNTTSQLMFAWQSTDATSSSQLKSSNDFSMVSLGIYRTFAKEMSGGLNYWHSEQTSSNQANSYIEDRVMANVFVRF